MAEDYEDFLMRGLDRAGGIVPGGGEGISKGGGEPSAISPVSRTVVALISGETRMKDQVLNAVERGEIEAVFTVDALVEGADLHMFRHQLGARPTFSRIKKGQERGRINRRGPDEVGPKGELLQDQPRILFDVIDGIQVLIGHSSNTEM